MKDPWINFHRLQTLALGEQAPADRCKALKARMMNGAEIAVLHWAGLDRKMSLLRCSGVQC